MELLTLEDLSEFLKNKIKINKSKKKTKRKWNKKQEWPPWLLVCSFVHHNSQCMHIHLILSLWSWQYLCCYFVIIIALTL
jgi:hypothetical protein